MEVEEVQRGYKGWRREDINWWKNRGYKDGSWEKIDLKVYRTPCVCVVGRDGKVGLREGVERGIS